MRNALLFLAILLTLIFLAGGPEPLIDALIRLIVLAGIQIITHYLNHAADRPNAGKKVEPHRLRKDADRR
jgi:hypothetical protein